MKKLIAIALIAVMVLGLAACGSINESEVSVLWSGDGIVHVPNSLINAMERAMYIENISYKHYGANGDQAAQTAQALEALNAGCAALVVELVDASAAQEIVDAAKAKNVPVVFFNCEVDEAVVSGYDKAACVVSDPASIGKIQGTQIFEAVAAEKKKVYTVNKDVDRNEDGKISYLGIGDVAATVEVLNASLTKKGLAALESVAEGADASYIAGLTVVEGETSKDKGQLTTAEGGTVELIITSNDAEAMDVLMALQAHGFNTNKLTTHCIPVYTVGNDVDYKAYVLESMPAAPHALDTEDKAEIKALNNWWKADEAVKSWKDTTATVCSMHTVDWSELNEFLYTTTDVIGAGRLAGTTMVDYDTIATTVASTLSNLLTGEAVEAQVAKIPYTTN